VPDALINAQALIGAAAQCAAKLAEYREAGADLPIAYLPAGTDVASAVTTIRALGRP
jgi:alkanesulfonate monooxygenase SsuD/methylene tetrahydromethanopterin reductase-like flavin-dependent oxidoreductase (luciferase family)